MSSYNSLTRSIRTLSAILYILNTIFALRFLSGRSLLRIIAGLLTAGLCLTMLCVTVEAPKLVVERLEQSSSKLGGKLLFTFRGRYVVDLVISLLLFTMSSRGVVLGIMTLGLIFAIRFLGVKQPDFFNEIFRQQATDGGGGGGVERPTADTTSYSVLENFENDMALMEG